MFKRTVSDAFNMTDGGSMTYYVGIHVTINDAQSTVGIHQEKFVQDTIAKFGMADGKPASVPLPADVGYSKDIASPVVSTQTPFRELLGSFNYLAVSTRPDIATAVAKLSKYSLSPQEAHWQAAKHILRYLKSSPALSLSYRRVEEGPVLVAYADARQCETMLRDNAESRDACHHVFVACTNALLSE
jgi:hypothetical protein